MTDKKKVEDDSLNINNRDVNQPPNTPLNAGETLLEHRIARIVSSFEHPYSKRTRGEKNEDADYIKRDTRFKQIMEFILADRKKHELQARIDELSMVRHFNERTYEHADIYHLTNDRIADLMQEQREL